MATAAMAAKAGVPGDKTTTSLNATIRERIRKKMIEAKVRSELSKKCPLFNGIQEYWSMVENQLTAYYIFSVVWKKFTSNVMNICRIAS